MKAWTCGPEEVRCNFVPLLHLNTYQQLAFVLHFQVKGFQKCIFKHTDSFLFFFPFLWHSRLVVARTFLSAFFCVIISSHSGSVIADIKDIRRYNPTSSFIPVRWHAKCSVKVSSRDAAPKESSCSSGSLDDTALYSKDSVVRVHLLMWLRISDKSPLRYLKQV